MNNFDTLFNTLDNLIQKDTISGKNKMIEIVKEICCDDMKLEKDDTFETCINCGVKKLVTFELERPNVFHNRKFHNSTLIGYSSKTFNINRIHKFITYDYKETTLMKTLTIIGKICLKFELSGYVVEQSKNRYKELYIDKNISSRSNIKKAVYIYCIYSSCMHNKININLNDLIDHMGIKLSHFEKCMKKIDDKMIFTNNKILKYLKIAEKNNLQITEEILLGEYSKYINLKENINENSIIIGSIYELVKKDVELKKYIKMFKTTKITLNKFFNLIEKN